VQAPKAIDIKELIRSKNPKLLRFLPGFVLRYLRKTLHEKELNAFIQAHGELEGLEFCEAAVNYFHFKFDIKHIERIPKTGPIIIAMNHPLGGVDAMAFIVALKNHRKDLKFIVNDMLTNIENLNTYFVGINKHGKLGLSARERIKAAFQEDHALCIFPAGMVSRVHDGVIQDFEWKKTFITYGREFNRPIVPIHIGGQLSPFFYRLFKLRSFLGIKANVEMFYLADEMLKQKNKIITYTVGEPIMGKDINPEMDDFKAANWFKSIVYQLKNDK
jgi:1-acyl-sn-glycerol-3-phosphate acyltransferase